MEIKQEPVDYDDGDRIKEILGREFEREISEREDEIMRIETKIQQVKRLIHLVKYSASSCLYQREKLEDGVETGIHPCVKKFLKDQCEIPEDVVVDDVAVDKLKVQEPAVVETVSENVRIVRGTYRVRHEIVVGNISKWQGSREDGATHKWMIYIRDKTDENWGRLVKKVRYFLHESYKPHDIIDVTSWPFHLTRRGWGEFPVRLTIFFKHAANKPVDFVHELRLDKTCSGVDRLGGETVFELDLFHEDLKIPEEENVPDSQPVINTDHDYCLTQETQKNQEEWTCLKQLSSQALSTGAETSEIDALKNWKHSQDGPIVKWYRTDLIKRLSGITFFSTEASVKWFLKRWPMVTPHAGIAQYKNVHPYSFTCFESFAKSSESRRFAAEWYRAYKIRVMLETLNLSLWTTREILLYARMHGFAIVLTKQFFLPSASGTFSTYTCDIDRERDMRQLEAIEDQEIDVVGEGVVKPVAVTSSRLPLNIQSNWAEVVKVFSKQIGVRFGDEDLDDDFVANVSSVVLGHVLKLFLDDLLRKSLCNAWLRNQNRNPGSLEVADVTCSIIECPEFDLLTNVGLGSKN